MSRHSEQRTMMGWVAAKLGRVKRIPSLNRLLNPEPKVLSSDEAEREKGRHAQLTQKLAPEAKATEDQLQEFIERKNREYEARLRGEPNKEGGA